MKYSFQLQDGSGRLDLPHKTLISQDRADPTVHTLLRLLGYLLLFRERLQIDASLHDDHNPFRPDLVQLDFALRPALWVECGECEVERLDRLAVKAPEAEIWVLQSSMEAARELLHRMQRAELRRGRYRVVGFDAAFMSELLGLLGTRNRVFWVRGTLDPPNLQFEFNGLWFDTDFEWLRH